MLGSGGLIPIPAAVAFRMRRVHPVGNLGRRVTEYGGRDEAGHGCAQKPARLDAVLKPFFHRDNYSSAA